MKEETMRVELKTFEGLIRVLKALESRFTEIEDRVTGLDDNTLARTIVLAKRLSDLEDRVTENGG